MLEKITEQQRIDSAISKIDLKYAVITSIDRYFYRTVNYRYSGDPLSTLEIYDPRNDLKLY